MTVGAHFDTSGKNVANSDSRYLTLGAYFGTERSWPQLERDWIGELTENKAPLFEGVPYFHAREAMNLREGYDGWRSRESVRRLTGRLFNAHSQTKRDDLFGVSCTIDRK